MEFNFRFPEGFQWGVSTAAFQIEGAVKEDGRGESIWDRFCLTPGMIMDGSTGEVTCDHYHRWREDVQLMKELGIRTYRFSIAWPRIYPSGTGAINQKGIQFYSDLIDELIANGIEPAVTLFHWDLPQALQDRGGWANRDSADWFAQYARTIFEKFGDRVHKWMTLNEPWVACFEGYYYGHFAPGYRDFSLAIQSVHNMLRGHGLAVRAFREMGLSGEIGITLNLCPREAVDVDPSNVDAARRFDGFANRWFLDAIFKGTYPIDMKEHYLSRGVVLPRDSDEDMALISEPFDFLGINYYNIDYIREDRSIWPVEARIDNAFNAHRKEYSVTNYDWPILESGLTDLLVRLDREYNHPKLYITENGASFLDVMNLKGKVLDDCRIDYIERHIIACHRAIEQGVDLRGYYIWSLLDNFEWNCGFGQKFGLVRVDPINQDRTIKKSGYWYRQIIQKNGVC